MIRKYIIILLEIIPFDSAMSHNGKLLSEEGFSSSRSSDESTMRPLLKEAQRVLEISILQQDVLSGLACLAAFYED